MHYNSELMGKENPHFDTINYLISIGYPAENISIQKVYPTKFPKRIVFLYKKERQFFVVKICPLSPLTVKAAKNFSLLQNSFRFSGGHFPASSTQILNKSNYHVLTMPWLGYSFQELGSCLDMLELGQTDNESEYVFRGFSQSDITRLVERFRRDHIEFSKKYGIIHGDLFHDTPNNVVYHPSLHRLFPIDAEALAPSNNWSLSEFRQKVDLLESWMHENLLQV